MRSEITPASSKRPASVVWASVVLALGSIANILLIFLGSRSLLTIALALGFAVAFVAVSFGGRQRLSYLCGALALAAFALSGVWQFVSSLAAYQRGLSAPGASAVPLTSMALIAGLFALLFYRFTFGRPSRRFYGLL